MPDEPSFDRDAAYRKMLAIYRSIPPGPDHTERFLEKIHGPGWKERAIRTGPLTLEYGRRLRELEARVSRIERHLNEPSKSAATQTRPLHVVEPLKPVHDR